MWQRLGKFELIQPDWIEGALDAFAEVDDICGKVRVAPGKQKCTMGDQVL